MADIKKINEGASVKDIRRVVLAAFYDLYTEAPEKHVVLSAVREKLGLSDAQWNVAISYLLQKGYLKESKPGGETTYIITAAGMDGHESNG